MSIADFPVSGFHVAVPSVPSTLPLARAPRESQPAVAPPSFEDAEQTDELDAEESPIRVPAAKSPSRSPVPAENARPLHRIREVRQLQGVTLRTVARHTRKDIRTLRVEEAPTTDLRVSDLLEWQRVLDVPLAELLVDEDAPLSRPVQERAQLLRIMKTAASIQEKATTPTMKRLAQNLAEQLQQLMPELKEVSPWHSVGQRRSADELGRAADHRMAPLDVRFDHSGD